MKRHVAAVHEGKKPFKCEICTYRSSKKLDMNGHVATVHKVKNKLEGKEAWNVKIEIIEFTKC